MRRFAGALIALAIVAAALASGRSWIAELATAAGAGEAQRPLAGAGRSAPPVARTAVRVVILDGLSRADARGGALEALCAAGMDLIVDVGFPTKSLPVQSVLWTGLTAQQSGVAMRNQLPQPLPAALPAHVDGARAVVEAWTSIAGAAGFAAIAPPVTADRARGDGDPTAIAAWRRDFATAARDAVGSDARLVLVHVLSIDEAGHRAGRGAAYRAEIARADALLGELRAAAPDATWIVVSDHGHLDGGGHGDAEASVRLVRGCVSPRPPGAPARGDVHLVDVSRHLHDTLGVATPAAAVGRPLAIAAAAPDPGATLPRPSPIASAAAIVIMMLGVAAALRWGRPRAAAVAPAVVALAYVVVGGAPSLSARSPAIAVALGAAATAITLLPGRPGRLHLARVIALLVPAVTALIAAAIVARLPGAALGGAPARLPFVTAWWQIVVAAVTPALLVGAALAGAVVSGARTSGTRTAPSGGSDQGVRGPDNRDRSGDLHPDRSVRSADQAVRRSGSPC